MLLQARFQQHCNSLFSFDWIPPIHAQLAEGVCIEQMDWQHARLLSVPRYSKPFGTKWKRGTACGLAQGILIKQQKVPLCLKVNVLVKSMPAPVFCL